MKSKLFTLYHFKMPADVSMKGAINNEKLKTNVEIV